MSRSVYIIGSKGIPAKYGGFETFVEKLTENKKSEYIQYYVACMEENSLKSGIEGEQFTYNEAICFNIKVPNVGPARAVLYDILALKKSIEISKKNHDQNPIFYVLACRIGPFISYFKKIITSMNGKLFVNPDGHEWKRAKWSYPIRRYWKFSEKLMVKHADLLICDSQNIEKYIREDYKEYQPETTYIAYGTDRGLSNLKSSDYDVREWYKKFALKENEYYLVVGRFVPENNYAAMISEFMKSNSKKDFVIITNVEKNKFFEHLRKKTNFEKDKRIKFVGTVYDQDLLKYIRENAFAYIHGHEVGGTNPSLLEALSSTKRNLLLDVSFNREVGRKAAFYWKKEDLNFLINYIEADFEKLPKDDPFEVVKVYYNWEFIVNSYEELFI